MRTGRPRKPTALKKLAGTYRKDRHRDELEASHVAEDVEPPSFLCPEGRAKWKELCPKLAALGVLSDLDLPALAMWCGAWASYVKASRTLSAQGEVIVDRNGASRKSPWLAVQRAAIETMAGIGSQFGMTPSSRASLSLRSTGSKSVHSRQQESVSDENPFAEFAAH
jgi:P27 family predicted phage terminase small subunit